MSDAAAAKRGKLIVVPVLLGGTGEKQFSSYSFEVGFDPNVLTSDAETPFETDGTLSQGMIVVFDSSKPGRLGIAAANGGSSETSANGGELLRLRFRAVKPKTEMKREASTLMFLNQPIFEDQTDEIKVKIANDFAGSFDRK